MKILNITQDRVIRKVNEIFNEEQKAPEKDFPTTAQCRMDVACYVLNRTPPLYIVSDRGIAHIESDYQNKIQENADLTSLIYEAIKVVTESKRPHADLEEEMDDKSGFFFNFPSIMGKVYNGMNFEPLSQATLSLMSEGKMVQVMNNNWQNPYQIVKNTAGTFVFWPKPRKAATDGETKIFSFELVVESPGFETLSRFFEIKLESENSFAESFDLATTYSVPDIYLFQE